MIRPGGQSDAVLGVADAGRYGLWAASGVLLPTAEGRLLLVRNGYNPDRPISLPGGGIERGENPRQAAVREVREELGITVELTGLAGIDWALCSGRPPVAAFLYWAAPVTGEQLSAIRLQEAEITGYGLLDPGQVRAALPEQLSRGVAACLAVGSAGLAVELEDSWPVGVTADLPSHGDAGRPPGGQQQAQALVTDSGRRTELLLDPATYAATRPRIIASARQLFTDPHGRVLLARSAGPDPDHWLLAGGKVEPAIEMPRQAARREIAEELGWDRTPGQLLALDWSNPAGGGPARLAYIFDGGTVSADDLARIRLQRSELAEWRMCTLPEAETLLAPRSAARVRACLTARAIGAGPVELFDGRPAGSR
ncbi:NUDIX hydrolase [Kitasatospora sp. RB6PN24]|uniref:NUDIX hydrolase n=1 Tax=Kitasatospora humi TaxID=2893891 RepID=UPI001E3C54A2|nr:NUDIX hydrolase [Kitasatospora humi]MCC9309150.1 NUDIX hydrolase [Kitasatospora humi]